MLSEAEEELEPVEVDIPSGLVKPSELSVSEESLSLVVVVSGVVSSTLELSPLVEVDWGR